MNPSSALRVSPRTSGARRGYSVVAFSKLRESFQTDLAERPVLPLAGMVPMGTVSGDDDG